MIRKLIASLALAALPVAGLACEDDTPAEHCYDALVNLEVWTGINFDTPWSFRTGNWDNCQFVGSPPNQHVRIDAIINIHNHETHYISGLTAAEVEALKAEREAALLAEHPEYAG